MLFFDSQAPIFNSELLHLLVSSNFSFELVRLIID